VHTLIQDLQYAFRQLAKSPGFTITAVLTLAIGIGINTGGFSIMDAVVLHPLTVLDLNRVVTVYEQQNHGEQQQVSLANFADWQRQSHSFEELAVRQETDMTLTGAGDAARVRAEIASPAFFSVMRTNAAMGRVFREDEIQAGRSSVAVLSYAFWKSHFGADATILNRTIELDEHSYTIVGVMPKTMQYPSSGDVFLPFAPVAAQLANRTSHDYQVVGRLRKGVSPGQAQAEMNLIASQLEQKYPATNQAWQVKVVTLLDDVNGELTPLYFSLVQGATFFVLLVVCANIANLQFARGLSRRPEIAMRTALGASRGRLLRQFLTENIVLGLMGGAGGLLVAALYIHICEITMPEEIARRMAGWSNISLNGRALAYSLVLALVAGVLSGLAPALAVLRGDLVSELKSGSRSVMGSGRGRKLRNTLAVSQISLAVALVIGAALMCKGMLSMLHLADRYRPAQTLTFRVHLSTARYDTPDKLAAWYSQSLDRLHQLPGIKQAFVSGALPYSDDGWLNDCQLENRPRLPGQTPAALRLPVSTEYFNTLQIPVIAGRTFSASDDRRAQPVAVVSQSFAARYFPGENPLGHRIRIGNDVQTPWLTIVGVVEETNYSLWLRAHPAAVYLSTAQLPLDNAIYSIRTQGDPLSYAPAVRRTLAALDPQQPLDALQTYAQYTHLEMTGMFFVAGMLGVDALIALLLAAIGIFGVMANLVGERTREIGVRLAMGARREDILRMILSRAGWLTGSGVCIGLVLAFVLARGVANLLYEVRPDDPWVFAVIAATIVATALLASWLPARQAAHIDPMIALRDE